MNLYVLKLASLTQYEPSMRRTSMESHDLVESESRARVIEGISSAPLFPLSTGCLCPPNSGTLRTTISLLPIMLVVACSSLTGSRNRVGWLSAVTLLSYLRDSGRGSPPVCFVRLKNSRDLLLLPSTPQPRPPSHSQHTPHRR
jgi:hypothetical protein